jgi:5'-deoxynucleotidase YfbR-like HD superfamily hydrolase
MNLIGQVNVILRDLERAHINIPGKAPLNLLQALKKIPRTGKACRIDAYRLNLPKRTLYDHIISLAEQAEIFAKHTKVKINKNRLARMICFHDLSEILIGDVPIFTRETLYNIDVKTLEEKRRAVAQIAACLSPKLQKAFVATNQASEQNTKLAKFFSMIDQTDPIIAIWRYMFLFKKSIKTESFLEAMRDFFINPAVVPSCTSKEIARFIKFLQNEANAKAYFDKGLTVFEQYEGAFSKDEIRQLIEERKMHAIGND